MTSKEESEERNVVSLSVGSNPTSRTSQFIFVGFAKLKISI
jgi:hypothetical protein